MYELPDAHRSIHDVHEMCNFARIPRMQGQLSDRHCTSKPSNLKVAGNINMGMVGPAAQGSDAGTALARQLSPGRWWAPARASPDCNP